MLKLLKLFFIEMIRIGLSFIAVLGVLLLFIKSSPEEGGFPWNLVVLVILIIVFGLIKFYRGYYRRKNVVSKFRH